MVEQLPEMMVSPAWKGKKERLSCVDTVFASGGEFPTFGARGRNPKKKKKNRETDLGEFVQLNDLIVLFPRSPAEQNRRF